MERDLWLFVAVATLAVVGCRCWTAEYEVRSTQYSVPSTQYTVPSTQYPVPSTQYTVHSAKYSVPSIQRPLQKALEGRL